MLTFFSAHTIKHEAAANVQDIASEKITTALNVVKIDENLLKEH